jgi:hypothetical protein
MKVHYVYFGDFIQKWGQREVDGQSRILRVRQIDLSSRTIRFQNFLFFTVLIAFGIAAVITNARQVSC